MGYCSSLVEATSPKLEYICAVLGLELLAEVSMGRCVRRAKCSNSSTHFTVKSHPLAKRSPRRVLGVSG
jgi:hypothetical protein